MTRAEGNSARQTGQMDGAMEEVKQKKKKYKKHRKGKACILACLLG